MNKLDQKNWRIQGIAVKIYKNILIIGVVLGCAAPFVHIVLPKTAHEKIVLKEKYSSNLISEADFRAQEKILYEKYKFFGFTNKRRFAYAAGLPVCIFFCSLLLMYSTKFIFEKRVKSSMLIISSCFLFVSIYFITWTLWALKKGSDFPESLYYLSIILISLTITFALYRLYAYSDSLVGKLKSAISYILEIRNDHYQKIAIRSMDVDEKGTAEDIKKFEKRTKEELEKISK